MFVLVYICFLFSVFSMNVFNFDQARDGQNLSYATLSSQHVEFIPPWFIICLSHQVGKMDDMSPYQLYGSDGRPWFAFIFSQDINVFYIWGYFDKRSMLLRIINDEPQLYFCTIFALKLKQP